MFVNLKAQERANGGESLPVSRRDLRAPARRRLLELVSDLVILPFSSSMTGTPGGTAS